MKISDKGVAILIDFEGLKLEPYNDSAGFATIGVGHLIGKRPVCDLDHERYIGFTKEEAIVLLREDVAAAESAVLRAIHVSVSQNQFDAMVSLCYNIGAGNFAKSSVVRLVNLKMFDTAADMFKVWNTAGGKVVTGLINRRARERALFLMK